MLILLKVLIIDTFALSAAPIAVDALVEIFGTLLFASGVNTQEEVDSMSWDEVSSNVESGLSSGTINPLDVVVDGNIGYMEWMGQKLEEHSAVANICNTALFAWFDQLTEEDVELTAKPGIVYDGYGAVFKYVVYTTYDDRTVIGTVSTQYCDYIVVDRENLTITRYGVQKSVLDKYSAGTYEKTIEYDYTDSPKTLDHYYNDEGLRGVGGVSNVYNVYGDVRYEDGTAAKSDDEYAAEVGETADGETVTLEDIQSGTVDVNDVDIDYSKFDDTAIIDLLNQILAELDKAPVVAEEKSETVDSAKEAVVEMAGELDITELNNLQMPLGISDVFPFCLPFDFVRGMEILVAKPEVPVFKTVIDFGEINGWDLGEYPIEISFEKWEPVAIITRWTSMLLFMYSLIFISTKIVKGAGA